MRLLVRFLVPVAGVALIAACGGSSGGAVASSTSSSASTAVDRSADIAAVTKAWTSFFSKTTPIGQKEALLQNGTTTMKPAVQDFAGDPRVGQATATVQKVEFPAADQADVTYQISLNGSVVMGGMAGKAVNVNGHWLVSDATLCGLLQLAAAQGSGAGSLLGCS